MYNRYIPQEADYGPIPHRQTAHRQENGPPPPPPPRKAGTGRLSGLLGRLFQGEQGDGSKVSQTLSSLLKNAGLAELDTGDLLLALIVLFLILEDGDDLELLIALGLMLVFHLGEP